MQRWLTFFIFITIFSCIEPYNFIIENNDPVLVVDGFLSDKSYNDTKNYPSQGRYFTIKLTLTQDVTNARPIPVRGATVGLIRDDLSEVSYVESEFTPGLYEIRDENFAALPGFKYQLQIKYNEQIYESSWESLPDIEIPAMGDVNFQEAEIQKYVVEAGENVVATARVIKANIDVGKNTNKAPIYYRWEFDPSWIYIAPLSPSTTRPGYKCWVTSETYLSSYALQVDNSGEYKKELFALETDANERIWTKFSVLIIQYAMSEENYFFYKEMQDQAEGNSLIDNPPFNLKTNIVGATDPENEAIGFFGVVNEQATRWYFSKDDLSYDVENAWKKGCETFYGPPLPGCPEPLPASPACECKYCLDYSNGIATNIKPEWWTE